MATSVLIVEDEPEIREMLNFSLTRAGFTVIEAATGEMALQRLDTDLPDILIVDWMLPGMSGVELAKRIRRDELTSALPLLMLTARSEETDVLKSFESGIDDYMSKPFSPKELVARIKALLRRSGAPENDVLEASGIRIDLVSHRLTIEGKNINIGPTEYRLLELLMRNPDRVSKLNEIRDEVSAIETKSNSITLDLKLFILFILKNKHHIKSKEFVRLSELEYIKDKIFNEFKGNLQFQFAIEYMLYSYKSAKESIQILKDFYVNVEQKTEEHNQLIELQELKFMVLDSPIKKEEIDERSFKLIEKIKDIKSSSIKFEILNFRLKFLARRLENDEKAILEFTEYNHLLISSEGVNKLWVDFVINFLRSWSGSTYITKHPDEAQEKFLKCENYLKKIIDFGILSNSLIHFIDAKKEVLGNTKKYEELKKVSLDYLKMVKESIGVKNINYANACLDLGKVYENLKEGELSVKYRLMGIDSLLKLEQSDSIKKRLATAYGNLSHIYRNHLNDSKNTIICAQKSLEFMESFEKNKSYGISLYNLGRAYAMNNEFKKSADLMKQALQYFKESSNKEIYQKSVLQLNLGIILSEFDKETARTLLTKSTEKIESEDISIYISAEVNKRIKIAKNILKLKDGKL